MRDFLFRGKQVEGICAWAYGISVKAVDGKTYIITLWDNAGTWKNNPRLLYVEANPETVGEFTGLLDKSGKKIFGGDIIKSRDYHGERLGYVDYPEGRTTWFLCGVDGRSDEYLFNQNEIEIIGNIYDNPELLEEPV